MGCGYCQYFNPKDFEKCNSDILIIKARKQTSAIRYTAPCGEEFKFGAKITAPKSKKRKNR